MFALRPAAESLPSSDQAGAMKLGRKLLIVFGRCHWGVSFAALTSFGKCAECTSWEASAALQPNRQSPRKGAP
jgi:hypothetical protein